MRFKKTIAAILPMIISSGMVTNLLGSSLLTINAAEPAVKTEEIAVCGDVDGNGIVDAVDASSVLSYYALISTDKEGGFSEKQKIAADVNKDECINAVDASCILSYYAYTSTANGDIKSLTDFLVADKTDNTPVLCYFTSDIQDIYINEEKTVKFTVEASEKLPNDAISLFDGSDNFVSYMYDDGTNGDEKANDGIYSTDIVLGSDTPKNVKYYASTDKEKTKTRQICFYRDLTQDDIDGVLALNEKLKSFSFEEAYEYIKNSNEVSHYSINEGNDSISYKTIYGFGCVWEPQDDNSDNVYKGRGVLAIHDNDLKDNSRSKNIEIAKEILDNVSRIDLTPYNNHKIIVLDQTTEDDISELAGEAINKAFSLAMSNYGGENGLEVKHDSEVTIDCMKNLSDYDTVIMDCHGGTYKDNDNVEHPYICTGQIRSWWHPRSMAEDIMFSDIWGERLIIRCSDEKYGVTDEFFNTYYERGNLNNSIWYLGACHSLETESLANVLLDKGAETVLGFTGRVSFKYCDKMLIETFINGMILSSDTVGKSADEAMRIYGNDDNCSLKIVGNEDYRFVNYIMDPIHNSESLPYVHLNFNFSGDDMGVDVHNFESDPRFLYLTKSFSYAFGPTNDLFHSSTYKYHLSYNNSSSSDGNGLFGSIFPQANDGTYHLVDVIKDDYGLDASEYNFVLSSCNSKSNHYYKKIVYYVMDLRPSRQPQYMRPDNSDQFLEALCNETGGRYLTYSEDNVDYLVDLIDFRLNQY